MGDFIEDLEAAHDLLQRYTLVSTGGLASALPAQPGLTVDGRRIPLPADEASVAHILRHSAPSPHGQGYATVVDAAVRASHEVAPALVSFANPDWSDALQRMALQAASELFGEPADAAAVGVSLYKLLCYRPGDHFLPHRDTEHDEGMFATLVVQLPSACKGGALLVSHLQSDTTHDFGEASGRAEFYCHYACHFADVQHEVRPVTSGVRLALVYNLVWRARSEAPSASVGEAAVHVFRDAFNDWPPDEPFAAFALEHQYTEQALRGRGFDALKGHDRTVGRTLQLAARRADEEHQVRLFVVRAEKQEVYDYTGGSEYSAPDSEDRWEYRDTENEGGEWWTSTGELVECLGGTSLDLEEIAVIGSDPDLAVWDEGSNDIDGYTGNAAPTKTTTYRACVLVAWPAHAGSRPLASLGRDVVQALGLAQRPAPAAAAEPQAKRKRSQPQVIHID